MAGVVRQGARRPGAGWAGAAALLLIALPAARPALGAGDEMVPGGVWHLRAETMQEIQRQAIARDGQTHPLVDYLAGQPGLSRRMSGEVVRQVTAAEVQAVYGISDSWNLALLLPYRWMRQESSLEAEAGDPAAEDAERRLKTRTVSGLGNVRLTSLHRPVFSDSNGLILGWGVTVPGGPQQSDYMGLTTLDTRAPYRTLSGLLQYTYYPLSVNRARFDLRFALDVGFRTAVRTEAQSSATLHPPNTGSARIGWEQEFQSMGYGIFLHHQATTQSFLDNVGQNDIIKETRLGGLVTWGNLAGLETGPLAFPYQAGLRIDHMVLGYNVPVTTRLALFFRTYF
jgi:hypothetical protein